MKYFLFAVSLGLFLAAPLEAQNNPLETLSANAASVVHIQNNIQGVVKTDKGRLKIMRYSSAGGGVLVDSDVILTNAHVVKGKGQILVFFKDGSKAKASVAGKLEKYDLAFLKMEKAPQVPALAFSDKPGIQLHEKVYAIGSSPSLQNTISQGQITGIGTRADVIPNSKIPIEILQVSFNVYEGDSGSPVFDAEGKILGLTTAGLKRKNRTSYAVPAPYLKKAYELFKQNALSQ